ncbi:MAG: PQQ-binding-like beta-propeller repeat protein, partial [Gemmatimonadetes bacterium]|nr:PQQ-binding-like beta-propeller repeat protein [Gemmatimonadota bacterium]
MVGRIVRMVCVLALVPLSVDADNWPQWRGPQQDGVSTAKNLPASWSLEKNIIWKAELPSWSGSTPVIWGDRIFLTSPSPAQRPEEQEPGGPEIYILCLSKKDGSELWRYKLDEGNVLRRKHNKTSPSPVTDGAHVWVITGNGVVTCLDMDGKAVWSRDLQEDYGRFGLLFGYASSPILYDGKLILQVLHGMRTDDPSYVVALDASSGKEVWRKERPTDA